ncbi:MAG: ABC transporter permease [Gaiellaceae bacterium MAG52_C11]|nr:ABC transporter permease [Candidatus Gaiellasilicea maunaloa]
MATYVLRRAVTSVGLLVLSSMLIFVVLRLIPGDPTVLKLGGSGTDVDPRAFEALRHELGLDRSLAYQYVHWIDGILHWDFGLSYFSQYPVTTLITDRAGATFQLALVSLLLGLLIAVPAATLGAVWRNRVFDSLLSGGTALGMATPSFVTGIVLIVIFGVKLDLLPTQGYVPFGEDPVESVKTVLLPAVTLAVAIAAPIVLILRSSLDDVASAPYIRTAQGKGLLRRRIVLGHLLPNATIPTLTMVGVIVGDLLGGTVIVEYVFARPGLGSLMVDAVYQRDYEVLQALVLLAAAAFIVTSFIVDLLYGVLDPRLRVRGQEA